MRIDRYLFENGFAKSRTRASAMIAEGIVFMNGVRVTKPSLDVSERDKIEICGEVLRYVSRGGLKLEAAISAFDID
ncbi:MAG: TlyA family rRNA (cytidine-2'-O)-methyltransferase, partial [Clostridia bacterium]|nr:TlyA family rRNA (cytidine-2'-O)-methyltransferase [Clostridia bacterium]